MSAPVIKFGDSYILIQNLPGQIFWRAAVALAGATALWFSVRVARNDLARLIGMSGGPARAIGWQLVFPAYLTGGVLWVTSALFSPLDWRIAQLEAAGGSFGLTIWLLVLPRFLPSLKNAERAQLVLARSIAWIVACALTALIFIGVSFLGASFFAESSFAASFLAAWFFAESLFAESLFAFRVAEAVVIPAGKTAEVTHSPLSPCPLASLLTSCAAEAVVIPAGKTAEVPHFPLPTCPLASLLTSCAAEAVLIPAGKTAEVPHSPLPTCPLASLLTSCAVVTPQTSSVRTEIVRSLCERDMRSPLRERVGRARLKY